MDISAGTPSISSRPTLMAAPVCSGPDGFSQYEDDVTVWLHLTELADDKNGGALRMSLRRVAYDAARKVKVTDLIHPSGHTTLLATLRSVFGGRDFKRGQDAYRRLRTLYRGDKAIKVYLAEVGQALDECRLNGYDMSHQVACAIILDQSGLDQTQQATTLATAVSFREHHNSETSISVALRDLWGGGMPLKASHDAFMMTIMYAQHAAYMARLTSPERPRGPGGCAPRSNDPPIICWYCSKRGHSASACRKRIREGGIIPTSPPSPAGAAIPPAGHGVAAAAQAHAHLTAGQPLSSPAVSLNIAHERVHLIFTADGSPGRPLLAAPGEVVLDIGATATIAGMDWVRRYVARLPPAVRSSIHSEQAEALFTDGGGASQPTREHLTLPMREGGCTTFVKTWLVPGALPMLVSRQSMASVGVDLDVAAPSMTVRDLSVSVRLPLSDSGLLNFNALADGHAASTSPPSSDAALPQRTLVAVLTAFSPALPSSAANLHTQYGHAPASRLIPLIKAQGVVDTAVFDAVTVAYPLCLHFIRSQGASLTGITTCGACGSPFGGLLSHCISVSILSFCQSSLLTIDLTAIVQVIRPAVYIVFKPEVTLPVVTDGLGPHRFFSWKRLVFLATFAIVSSFPSAGRSVLLRFILEHSTYTTFGGAAGDTACVRVRAHGSVRPLLPVGKCCADRTCGCLRWAW